jgi:hypothetical protein
MPCVTSAFAILGLGTVSASLGSTAHWPKLLRPKQ